MNNLPSPLLPTLNVNDRQNPTPNEPFWTLAVEVQFYLWMPLLLVTPRQLPLKAMLGWIVVPVVVSYLANLGFVAFLLERDQWPIEFTLFRPFRLNISVPESFMLTYSTLAHRTLFLTGIAMAVVYPALSAKWSRGGDFGS